jgi:hypothetical protein
MGIFAFFVILYVLSIIAKKSDSALVCESLNAIVSGRFYAVFLKLSQLDNGNKIYEKG